MYFDQKEFGKRIQSLRKRAGMTQEQLAEKLSFDRPHLARIETGTRSCSIDTLLEFSELFGVSTDYLLKGSQDMKVEKEQLLQIARQLTDISQNL